MTVKTGCVSRTRFHSRGELLVVHDVVADALVDYHSKTVFESSRSAIVGETTRINLKKVC